VLGVLEGEHPGRVQRVADVLPETLERDQVAFRVRLSVLDVLQADEHRKQIA
jgi:hypothetical protein